MNPAEHPDSSLLSVSQLEVTSTSRGVRAPILRGVSFDLKPGESLGIVGESGSGKSMTIRAITRQLPTPLVASGEVRLLGDDVLKMTGRELARMRSSQLGIIHQDPRAYINPMWTIGNFLIEGVLASKLMSRVEAVKTAEGLLLEVGINDPELRMRQYPHELSGGLLQRVMIVSALMTNPRLLLADEPTTALDVTVQAEVMSIFADVTKRHGVGLVFVTHDLDLAAAATDNIAVMYAGRIVEYGPSARVIGRPSHPYTAGLLAARPDIKRKSLPVPIPGQAISAQLAASIGGCSFAERCSFSKSSCFTTDPQLRVSSGGSQSACLRADDFEREVYSD